jgi:hypothetical protein
LDFLSIPVVLLVAMIGVWPGVRSSFAVAFF